MELATTAMKEQRLKTRLHAGCFGFQRATERQVLDPASDRVFVLREGALDRVSHDAQDLDGYPLGQLCQPIDSAFVGKVVGRSVEGPGAFGNIRKRFPESVALCPGPAVFPSAATIDPKWAPW